MRKMTASEWNGSSHSVSASGLSFKPTTGFVTAAPKRHFWPSTAATIRSKRTLSTTTIHVIPATWRWWWFWCCWNQWSPQVRQFFKANNIRMPISSSLVCCRQWWNVNGKRSSILCARSSRSNKKWKILNRIELRTSTSRRCCLCCCCSPAHSNYVLFIFFHFHFSIFPSIPIYSLNRKLLVAHVQNRQGGRQRGTGKKKKQVVERTRDPFYWFATSNSFLLSPITTHFAMRCCCSLPARNESVEQKKLEMSAKQTPCGF